MKSLSTSALASNVIGRRALLGIIPAWLALPRLSAGSTLEPGRPSAEAGPFPVEDDETRPPKPPRILDPSDPVAVELGRLWEKLRACHAPEIRAQRAVYIMNCEGEDLDDDDVEGWKSHSIEVNRLYVDVRAAGKARGDAYHALLKAIIAAHHTPDEMYPYLSAWHRTGRCHRIIRVGNRLFTVSPSYGADWPDEEGDEGDVTLSVIDL